MEIRLLGPIEVVEGDRTISFARSKERAVLVALALRLGEVVSEAKLFEALWGEEPPPSAEAALQAHISRVRKALGPSGSTLERRPGGYRLSAEGVLLDSNRAVELLDEARRSGDPGATLLLLDRAASLWRGPSLGDLGAERFALGEAARLEELRVVILEERVSAALELGRHTTVIPELEGLCAEHPLRERLWSLRMLALFRAGRQPEALRVYQELRSHFVEELGLEPSEEIRSLDRSIARADTELAWRPPLSAEVGSDLGATAELPSGVVTFLLSDIEGSTALWESAPQEMSEALAHHDELVASVVGAKGGILLKTRGEGDSTFSVFASVSLAATAAIELQAAIRATLWIGPLQMKLRMSIHTGEAELREGDYFGPTVNRAARMRAVAHGGQVLCSQATAQLLVDKLPEGATLKSLGSHRLADLARPETVFQLGHYSIPSDFPPLQSLEALPNNLPVQLTSFVGRDEELAHVAALLPTNRVVTLTGVGGVGKTRLALQVAAEVLPSHSDGVWLIELGGLADPAAIEEAVASACGISQQTGETLGDTVVSFLRNKRMLLILDNCEHLLDGVIRVVKSVLGTAAHVHVLATSREPLGVSGEHVVGVPSLSVPEVVDDIEGVASESAVELFVERGRAVRTEFALTAENAGAVAQLCRRLDGIPLAIELAAARLRSMTPEEIAARLDQRFRLLTGSARSSASRHQTLRRAVEWSYNLLDDGERQMLANMSVCVGGFDLAAAEAIGASDTMDPIDADDLIGRLVDKSLIGADDDAGATRYRMLETIRAYALEALETEGDLYAARTRHAQHYASFAVQASDGLKGPDERAWLTRVENELDNLRAAVAWSLESEDLRPALAIVDSLGLTTRRIEPVVGSWAASIVESPTAKNESRYPCAVSFLAWARLKEGNGEDASALAQRAVELLDQGPDDPALACRVLQDTTGVDGSLGRAPGLRADQWLSAAREAGDAYQQCLALNMRAVSMNMIGDEAAVESAEEAVAVARGTRNPTAIALCSFTLAMVLIQPDPTRAAELLEDTTRYAMEASNDFALLVGESVAVGLLSQAGEHRRAARAWVGAARRAFTYGHRAQQATNLYCTAASLAVSGSAEPAAKLLGWAETIYHMDRHTGGFQNLHTNARKAFDGLEMTLGEERYLSLKATGAAMSDEEALCFAEQQLATNAMSGSEDLKIGEYTPQPVSPATEMS